MKKTLSQRRRATFLILVGLMFTFILIGNISAWEWDNVLTTEKSNTQYPILTIENALGLGDDIVRMLSLIHI